MNIFEACRVRDHARVTALLAEGTPINGVNINGDTALHVATQYSAMDIVTLLIGAGADINVHAQDDDGMTPLHVAVSCDAIEITTYLIAHDAIVDAVDQNGMTPLHYAAGSNCVAIITALLAAGANVEARTLHGTTPLHECYQYFDDDDHDYQENIMLLLTRPGMPGRATAGADINAQTPEGDTLLHDAVRNNDINLVRFLLDAGAHSDIRNEKGETPADFIRDEAMTTLLRDHRALNTIKNAARRK